MLHAALFVLVLALQQAAPAPQPAPAATPATPPTTAPAEPAPPETVYDTGPMGADIIAMREIRLTYTDSPERSAAESNFAMQVRIRGDKLGKIARFGNLILTEVVDDTGKAMLDPNTYSEQDRTAMRQQVSPIERIRTTGLLIATRALPSARGAKAITKLRGAVKLVLSDSTEKVTVVNPQQFIGKAIESPRLTELGVVVRVIPSEEFEAPQPAQRCIALQVTAKADNVQSVAFFDGQMQPVRHRENPATTKGGAEVTLYCLDGGAFTNETQLVFEVHPQVEIVDLPVSADNLPLP